jgi:hypothetical protein
MNKQEEIAKHHHPELAQIEGGNVYQVWEDGEVTLTKCGSLLGHRTLHTIEFGDKNKAISPLLFPEQRSNGHGFIYTDRIGVAAIRKLLGF